MRQTAFTPDLHLSTYPTDIKGIQVHYAVKFQEWHASCFEERNGFRALQPIFLFFSQENELRKAIIPFIGV